MRAGWKEAQSYTKLRRRRTPRVSLFRNCVAAFAVGGSICAVGQLVANLFRWLGFSPADGAGPVAGTMIFIGALLTGLGVYDRLGSFAGMGAALPITGFANAIVSPAMEFKREGLVQGVGARMFEVAGPVLVYGLTVSFFIGAIRYLLRAY
ncbi:MAG: stage V sporulation protein AC [Bacillota bacterium]